MALKIWLPLDGDLRNLGCSDYNISAIETTPTYTSGKIGQCYQRIDSNTQSTRGININNNLLDILGTEASIAVWVKPLGTHTHYNGTIVSSGNWNAKKWAFGVSQDNSQVDVLCGGYNNYITCAVPVNEWTHLVSTFNNGICKLYKNGVYIGEKTGQAAFVSDASNACIGRETYASGYFGFNGCINDIRIYDHCLSPAEVHEIAQGLVLHYKLDDPRKNCYTNIAPTPINDNGSYNTPSRPWDITKHQDAIIVRAWSDGYNGGVQEPTKGYHAMWKLIDDIPTAVFQNHNSEVGYKNRWLGIASDELSYTIPAGMKYTLSYEQKTLDTLNSYTCGGIYYKTKSANGYNFYDGCPQIGKNTVLNKWEHFSRTFTRSSDMDDTGTAGRIYVYGYYSPESTMLIRNIKLEIETYNSSFWDSVNKNIFSSFSAGGRTTLSNNIIKTTGEDADTYFYINSTAPLVSGKNYTLQIYCNGLPTDGYWIFGAGAQSSTNDAHIAYWRFENGLNTYNFTCPSGLNNQTRFILDDNGRPNYNSQTSFYNAKLFENTIDTIVDSSGYGHNGTINGTLTVSSNTVKYSSCVYMPKTTTITHLRPIYGGTDQEWTCCMWVKLDTTSQSGQQMNNFNSGNNIVHGANGNPLLYLNSGANDYYNYGNLAVSAGVWTHIAFVFKNSNATKLIYINGENHTNTSGPNRTSTPSGIQDIVTVGYNLAGYIADYRIYTTALLDTDIKLLYNIGMRIDNLGSIHTFEFLENEEKESIKNTGQIITKTLDESRNIAKQSKNYGWFSPNFIEI